MYIITFTFCGRFEDTAIKLYLQNKSTHTNSHNSAAAIKGNNKCANDEKAGSVTSC